MEKTMRDANSDIKKCMRMERRGADSWQKIMDGAARIDRLV